MVRTNLQNKIQGLLPVKKLHWHFWRMKNKWVLCKHIPNSGGNPCRFAISLGVKYLSFSVDSFPSFSSSGKFSMCLNTDSSYKEYPRQSSSLCRQNMWNYAVTIISQQPISLIITVPKTIWKHVWSYVFAANISVPALTRTKSMLPWGNSSCLPPVYKPCQYWRRQSKD